MIKFHKIRILRIVIWFFFLKGVSFSQYPTSKECAKPLTDSVYRFFLFVLLLAMGSAISAPPPNIIFVLTDDQRWNTLGSMGNEIIQTPQIDSLAREGVTFENAYATTAICYASRGTIYTGQYLSRNGLNGFSAKFSDAALAQTYFRVLRDSHNYYTGFIGKWGLGGQPSSSFDKWWGFEGLGEFEIKTNGVVTGHITPLMGDQAEEFLDAAGKTTKPFCLSISFNAPHIKDGDSRQYIPDPADKLYYANDIIPKPPLSDPEFFNALPDFLKDPKTQLRTRWDRQFSTPSKYQESMKNYYRLITGIDHVVGRIRIKLEKLKQDKNTVIIFSSDHGYFVGDRGYSGKWMPHQASSRVPMIIFDPRFTESVKGKRYQDIVLNLDIPSTILGLAGAQTPVIMQGRNMMDLVNGAAKTWRSEFLFEETTAAAPASRAVITQRYSYILYPKETPVYEELYDLEKDPIEEFNLVKCPKYQKVLDSLRNRFEVLEPSVAKDNVIKELVGPVSNPTTTVSKTNRYTGRVHKHPSALNLGRKTFVSESGNIYDGSGKQVHPKIMKK